MEERTFALFNDLSDEICIHILSYVSTAPFEAIDDFPYGTLTHELPLISKKISHLVSTSDTLWKDAIVRLYMKEPDVWKYGIEKLLAPIPNEMPSDCIESTSKVYKKVEDASLYFIDRLGPVKREGGNASSLFNSVPSMQLFKHIVSSHLRLNLPAFVMQGEVLLEENIQLHFFEPRYRLLVRELVNGYVIDNDGNIIINSGNSNERNITGIKSRFPQFVYAYQGSLAIGSPACVVELRQCAIFEDGRANVTLVPCCHVKIEKVWERENSGGLYYVKCLKMSKTSSALVEDVMRRHRRYWINNTNGIGEENHWVDGGTLDGRVIRGSIRAILPFYDRDNARRTRPRVQNNDENDERLLN